MSVTLLFFLLNNFRYLVIFGMHVDIDKLLLLWICYNPLKELLFISNITLQGASNKQCLFIFFSFSLYIYIENFKNLLLKNHWTEFNVLW